jgi:hypothetical protein
MENVVPDIKRKILLSLPDRELVNLCQVNKKYNSICKDDTFWKDRMLNLYPYIPDHILERDITKAIIDNIDDIIINPENKYFTYYIKIFRRYKDLQYLRESMEFDDTSKIIASVEHPDFFDGDAFTCDYDTYPDTNIIVYNNLLNNIDKQKLCDQLRVKFETSYKNAFNDNLTDPYLISLLFNSDIGYIDNPITDKDQDNILLFRSSLHTNKVIISKIDWPEGIEEFYNNEKNNIIPGIIPEPFSLVISPNERDFVLKFHHKRPGVVMGHVSPVEVWMLLLLYNLFKSGKYPLDIKITELCSLL